MSQHATPVYLILDNYATHQVKCKQHFHKYTNDWLLASGYPRYCTAKNTNTNTNTQMTNCWLGYPRYCTATTLPDGSTVLNGGRWELIMIIRIIMVVIMIIMVVIMIIMVVIMIIIIMARAALHLRSGAIRKSYVISSWPSRQLKAFVLFSGLSNIAF